MQSGYLKAILEQAADRSEKVMSRLRPVLIAPQPSKARCHLQFPKPCVLTPRQGESSVEAEFCFLLIRLAPCQQQLTPNPMKLCFDPLASCVSDLGQGGLHEAKAFLRTIFSPAGVSQQPRK